MKIKNITSKDAKLILSKSGISKTKFRTNLLNLFINSNKSLSVEEIMDFFENSINKVTVYRSLDSFENKGIIHKVPDSNNHKRYSLCNDQCNINSHNHGHFICYSCSQTFCLDSIKSPDLTNLKDYDIKELKLIIEGYCKDCRV